MDQQDLPIRRVAIDTWRENVAYLHRECPIVRATGFQALSKVTVRAGAGAISAVLNVVDDERLLARIARLAGAPQVTGAGVAAQDR